MTVDISMQELAEKRQSAMSAALSLLTGTTWPPETNAAVEALRQTISDLPELPADAPGDRVKDTVLEFIRVLEGVHANLTKASEKYGTRERGFRDGIKYNLSLRRGKCIETLLNVRNEMEKASADLRNRLQSISTSGQTAALQHLSPGPAEEGDKWAPIRDGALIAARKTFKTAETVSKAIPGVGGFVEVAANVGLAFVNMIETMDKNEDVSKELASHTTKLASYLEHLKKMDAEKGDEVATQFEDLHNELECVQKKVKLWNSSGRFKKAFLSSDHAEELKGYQDMIQNALLVSLKTADVVMELKNTDLQAERTRLLDRLGDGGYGARGNAIEDVICLPGTRVKLLSRINEWIRDTSPSSDRVLWIRGMAGRGKSTIAATVAHNWASKGSCAIFHFRRGQNTLDRHLVCSLARQLGKGLVPELKNAILDCVRENEDIAQERLERQFKILLVGSLERLQTHAYPILIIVDALDECQNESDAVRFVRLIDQHSSLFPASVKFLLTCRPEAPLLRVLEPREWHAEDLDAIPDVAEDIGRLIQHACKQIREEHDLPQTWPSPTDLGRIVEMSQGLFQWARTAMAYIGKKSPEHRMRELAQRASAWGGLDDLYHQILSRAFNEVAEDSGREEMLSSVLGTLVVAPYPVTLEVIAFLHADHDVFNDQKNIVQFLRKDILADLNSLLYIPATSTEPMRLMHTSIRDLLTARKRCKDERYYIDSTEGHLRLANVVLQIMERDLKRNICDLRGAPANLEIRDAVDTHVGQGLRYCCRSWSRHLMAGVQCSGAALVARSTVLAKFHRVSEKCILSWLEVMSLIGAMAEAYAIAKQVNQWLGECPRDISDPCSSRLWNDTQRFINSFFKPMSLGALGIYTWALPRCPMETELWLKYGGQATGWVLSGEREGNWSSHIWTADTGAKVHAIAFSPGGGVVASRSWDAAIRLWDAETGALIGDPLTGDTSLITSVVFSPDGKVLASGSPDNTVRLWDAQTGAPLGNPLTGHSGSITSVVFSPDSKALASGSYDETVRLWDWQTGAPLGNPLTGHSDWITSVVFSPGSKILASGSHDKTVRLWDAQTGAPLGHPLTGHSDWITSVVFWPNGNILASGSNDNTVRLWDAQTGAPLGNPLTGHSDWITSVVFSPDGKVLASGSPDNTVRLWDTQTGTPLGNPLTGHSRQISSVVFSPNGKVLASGSHDWTVRLWDAQTGAALGHPLTGHSDLITSVVFSPDGKGLASGSHDGTVRLWDPQTRAPSDGPPNCDSEWVTSVVFSRDCKGLASGLSDGTIRLWNAQTGAPLGNPLTGHSSSITSVFFSPDGTVLASGSDDQTVRLWDAQTGAPLGNPLTGHSSSITSVLFSLDGTVLASGSDDQTVRLWDAQTGAPLGNPLTGHSHWITSVVFSPGSKILASGSHDETVRLWDAQTGAPFGNPLTGHSDSITSLVFSPDGKVLASGSHDETVRLWDAHTGAPLGNPLIGHSNWTTSLVFSPGGKILASGSRDETIRLWDAQTGAPLGNPLTGHSDSITSVVFSPDGKILASGSSDETVRLWDAQTGAPLGNPLTGHSSITSVVFSPDGRFMASISNDGTVLFWDPLNYQLYSPASRPSTF